MTIRFRPLLAGLLLTAAALAAPTANRSLDQITAELARVRDVREAAVSPDGRMMAWVEAAPLTGKSSGRDTMIYVRAIDGGSPRRISAGDGKDAYSEHHVVWSPDGHSLAFLSDKEKHGQLQIYVAEAGDGKARKLTSLTGFVTTPHWSPDGRQIAFLFVENAKRASGATEAMTPDEGVVEEKVYIQRISVVDVASGRVRQVSRPDLFVYEYDWSPDGKRFAATAAPGPGENNWWIAQLYTVDAATGEMRSILKPPLQIAVPRWSPDGKSIAYIGGLMSDQGSTGGDIYLIPASGGAPRDLTPNRKSSPAWLDWLPSGRILFTETADGGSAIAVLRPGDGVTERLWQGPETIRANHETSSLSVARDEKTVAMVRSSWQLAPEAWAGPLGEWKQMTRLNADQKPRWGAAKSLHWTNQGADVQGWLLYPVAYDPAKRYPLIVSVHGGPAAARKPTWPSLNYDATVFSQEGYFVLLPNPRGSFGGGERFTQANVKDFGHGDLQDILAGVDEVTRTLPVDSNRVGITGWSYGGYMTMWAVTQTNRFRAAVAGAGIANWQSYYGENSIDQWMIPYFGASVYDDPAVYAKSSPINYIKRVKTPTLIVVGDRDGECPPAQSYEFWHALKTLGVKTQFVVYPGEGHHLASPEHRRDLLERALGWFRQEMPANTQAAAR